MNREVELEIGAMGKITHPSLHDGSLSGMSLKEPETLLLFVSDEDGDRFEIELNGLIRFKANNFLEGNTILEVFVLTGSGINLQMLANVYGVPLDKAKDQPYFQESRRQLEARKLSLLSLTSSYGCEALALFREFKIRRIS